MVKTWVLRQGIKVLSLVEELRSHLPCGPKKEKTIFFKQKQYCNKFNKDFKNGPWSMVSFKKIQKNL